MSITLTIPGATFLDDGIRIGDIVVPTVPNALSFLKRAGLPLLYDTIKVINVISQTSLQFDAYVNDSPISPAISDTDQAHLQGTPAVSFAIKHLLSKDEQADEIAALARSYASKRVVLVWPPKADWVDGNGETVTLDGSSCAAALGAAISAYPAQQGFTNLPFPGPKKLYYSNTYFTKAQLNRMTDAGVCVLVQDAEGANVYARHQKTTSTTSIQESELSITKAVDKVSIDCYVTVKPFIGKYNINHDLLTQIHEILNQYFFDAQNNKAAYCGALIISYKNISLRANLDGENQDLPVATIEISVDVEVGYPANFINIKLLVR